jgi:hypothetical protein
MTSIAAALLLSIAGMEEGITLSAHTADAGAVAGRLVRFDDAKGLVVSAGGQGGEKTVRPVELIAVRFGEGLVRLRAEDVTTVRLRGGDVLRGSVAAGDENALKVRLAEGGSELSVPLADVEAVVYGAPEPKERAATGAEDIVVFRNGDRAAGVLAGFTPNVVKLAPKAGGAEQSIPLLRVAAVLPASVGGASALPKDRPALRVRLRRGTVLTAAGWEITPESATLKLPWGATLEGLSPADIAEAETVNGRAVPLSSLEPSSARHEPAWPGAATRSATRDRGVLGGPLSVGGRTYERGWGMAARGTVEFALDGKFRRLVGSAGTDDSARAVADPLTGRPFGACTMRVLADGKPVWEKAAHRAGDPAARLDIDLTGVKRLTLVVEDADPVSPDGIAAHAAWVGCSLIREK